MDRFFSAYHRFFRRWVPSPLTLALGLTLVVAILAMVLTRPVGTGSLAYLGELSTLWFDGLWTPGLLAFAVKMMLMLVLGHIIALATPARALIDRLSAAAHTTTRAVLITTVAAVAVSLFNWGFGLIFGAILAREVGLRAQRDGRAIDYPLVAAAGYAGLMVWHGGLSGSAPLDVNDPAHGFVGRMGVVPVSETLFAPTNLVVNAVLILVLPVALVWLGKAVNRSAIPIIAERATDRPHDTPTAPAERFEASTGPGRIVGLLLLAIFVHQLIRTGSALNGLNLNTVILLLLALAFLSHGSIRRFASALGRSIGDVSGILIQFPLYFGIMGIMNGSGLVDLFSRGLIGLSSGSTLPFFTFVSAGVVNFFVPSGGGQWKVQAPILIDAARTVGVEQARMVMALAYGDQLTNMLQPFWALPLLGITGLGARDILPYTLFIFLVGAVIFGVGVLI